MGFPPQEMVMINAAPEKCKLLFTDYSIPG